MPKILPEELHNRGNEVLTEVKIARRKKPDIEFMLGTGEDVFNGGSLEMSKGGFVGLPYNFTFKSVDDINKAEIKVLNGQAVKWDTKVGKKLLDSMVLSPKAQKFAMAREIHYMDNNRLYFLTGASIVSAVLAKALCDALIKYKDMMKKPVQARVSLYALCTMFAIAHYFMWADGLNCHYEAKSDMLAATTSDEYYEGGIEYYTKMLQRNKCFRKMLGEEGAAYFTSEGDARGFIRSKSIPFTRRLFLINDIKNN